MIYSKNEVILILYLAILTNILSIHLIGSELSRLIWAEQLGSNYGSQWAKQAYQLAFLRVKGMRRRENCFATSS
jgi:hypothetical protein